MRIPFDKTRPKERFGRGAKGDEAREGGHNGLKAAVINPSLTAKILSCQSSPSVFVSPAAVTLVRTGNSPPRVELNIPNVV